MGHASSGASVTVEMTNVSVQNSEIYTTDTNSDGSARPEKAGDLIGTVGTALLTAEDFTAVENDVYAVADDDSKQTVEQAIGRIGNPAGEVMIEGNCYYDGEAFSQWSLNGQSGTFAYNDAFFHKVEFAAGNGSHSDMPKTGDDTPIALLACMLVLTCAGMVMLKRRSA